MRSIALVLVAAALMAGVAAHRAHSLQKTAPGPSPIFVTRMPMGYRNYKLISVAHEAGNLNSLGAVLGNDVAIKAYRSKTLPFPDGTIIAALHYTHTANDENNKIFGQPQSFTPGKPTNIQFMIKDSKKYAATGGWGFGHFNADGTLGNDTLMKTCYPCHARETSRDLVFTQYAP